MTTNIAKIRAALDLYDRLDDSYTGWAEVFEGAYSALAELEKAAAPQFVAGEVSDTMARKLWREWFDASGITGVESAHFWLKALRRELGPALGLVEIREPTPEECTDMAEWFKSECAACCINPQESADYGRAIFDAVKIVMWPKEGL